MESERPIEKRLRDCAKKRRADAGGAFPLPPWVRRNLQAAVAKQFVGAANAPFSFWQMFRHPRTALAGLALLILIGVSVFVLPSDNATKPARPMVLAANRPAPAAAPAPADALEARNAPLKTTRELAVAAPMAKTAKPENVIATFSDLAAAAYEFQAVSQTPVLSKFELKQDGNEITIVDGDGSVYRGLVAPEAVRQKAAGGTAAAGAANTGQADYILPFRVTGENRTLKQTVVFTGSQFWSSAVHEGLGKTNAVIRPTAFSPARIAGTATLAATNQIQIEAVPVTP